MEAKAGSDAVAGIWRRLGADMFRCTTASFLFQGYQYNWPNEEETPLDRASKMPLLHIVSTLCHRAFAQNVNFGLDPQGGAPCIGKSSMNSSSVSAIATAVYYGATAAMATTAALQSQASGYTPGPKRL